MPFQIGIPPHNDKAHVDSAKRAGDSGVAGLYGCNTLLHRHINPGMEEYHACQIHAATGFLAVNGGAGTTGNLSSPYRIYAQAAVTPGDNGRVVIPYQYPATGNFYEVSAVVHGFDEGVGDGCLLFLGMAQSGADIDVWDNQNLLGWFCEDDGEWFHGVFNTVSGQWGSPTIDLGRQVQNGDMLTARMYRHEGSANIDSWAFYVNGLRVAYVEEDSSNMPLVGMYPIFGAYSRSAYAAPAAYSYMEVRQINMKYNP